MSVISCPEFEPERVERYLLDTMSAEEREAFERHVFECPDCAREVAFLSDLRSALRRVPAESLQVSRRPAAFARQAALAAAVVAAVAILGWGGYRWWSGGGTLPSGAPSGAVAELVKIVPPRYEPTVLRGDDDPHERSFRDAMAPYAKGEFAAAIPRLESLVGSDPQDNRARFYLGACYLLGGRTDDGIAALRLVSGADGDPFQEEASFLVAKALLRQGKTQEARNELQEVIGLHGELEKDARSLLESSSGNGR